MTAEPTIWQRRWQAIDHTLSTLQDRYESFLNEDSTRRENTIFEVLRQLQQFAAGQFRFFHDGFYTKRFVELLPIPDDRHFAFPQFITGHSLDRYVMHHTLQQIAEDTEVIQRASEQRLISTQGAVVGLPGQAKIALTLADVDKLALSALRMVHSYLSNEQQTVLTYFHRAANVRVIPYAPVAMIGIPITTIGLNSGVGVAEDLLAIPHEMSHHLYWNGRADSGERLYVELANRIGDNPARAWQEEIFADVVGCLIGGPVVARSFIDLQLTTIAADFVYVDDPHPTPALRPLLYAYTLEKMGFTNSAAMVHQVWEGHLKERMTFVNRKLLFAAYQIVDEILALISQNRLSPWLRWSNDDGSYETLYERFALRIPTLVSGVSENDLDPEDLNIQTSWHTIAFELSKKPEVNALPEGWTNRAEIEAAVVGEHIPFDAAAWLRIYDAGGWITAGPGPKQIGD